MRIVYFMEIPKVSETSTQMIKKIFSFPVVTLNLCAMHGIKTQMSAEKLIRKMH